MTQTVLLGDICKKVTSGGTPLTKHNEYYDGEIPWLRTQEVNFTNIYSTEKTITQEGLKNSSAKIIPENSVIVAMYGVTAGKSAINKIPLTTNQACCNLIIEPSKADYRFIYYILVNDYKKLLGSAIGAAQQNLSVGRITQHKISLPRLSIQKTISDFLSCIDEKIEVNRRMNETLEQMGQALFKHYFIDNPESKTWPKGSLADYGSFKNGVNYGREDIGDSNYKIVNVRNLSNEEFVTAASLDNLKIDKSKAGQYELTERDVLIVRSACPGNVAILDKGNAIYSGFIIRFRVHEIWQKLFAFYLLKIMKPELLGHSDGTTLKNINQESLKSFKINLPPKDLIEEFDKDILATVNSIFNNLHEIENLVKIRDTLLPRLISGKIAP